MINLLEAFKNEDGFTKKKFGQHFLTNKSMLDKIIEAADITENDNVIEIGPGCGVLTQLIAETKASQIRTGWRKHVSRHIRRILICTTIKRAGSPAKEYL